MKRVWITGAAGHVGSALSALLDEVENELFLTDTDVDVTDLEQVLQFCRINRPDVIINCASVTGIEECEKDPDAAYRVNAIGVKNIALSANEINAKVIHISTDDVFGMSGAQPYNEFDDPIPTTVYGKSKYAGEKILTQLMNRFVIIRSSWIYGIGRDFVNEVLDSVKSGSDMSVPSDVISSPTSAKELALVIQHFIEVEDFGLYHASCQGTCSRLEYALAILKYTGNEGKIKINAVDNITNQEATYGISLDNMMLRLSGVDMPGAWEACLEEYLNETGGDE